MRFFSVPLGHKFTAVLVAAAAGFGIHTWLQRRAVQTTATAELSFSLHAARRLDAGFVHASDPAVVFAQSVLSDQRIADLSRPAFLSTSGMMSRVGEFRSRLDLTQPSPEVLRVRFRDPDPAKAVETANKVADALVAWSPSPDAPGALTEPAPPATHQPPAAKAAPAPAPAPAKKPTTATSNNEASENSSPLAAALEQLQTQLSSTSHQVEEGATAGHARPGYQGRAYAESEQQRLLKTQVRDAQKKVSDLRSQYGSGANAHHLGAIQQALASVLAGGSVGVSASQLRRERDGLTRAIEVVETQRAAIVKEAGAAANSSAAAQTPAPPANASNAANAAQAPAASGSGSSPISESDLTKAGTPVPASPSSQAARPTRLPRRLPQLQPLTKIRRSQIHSGWKNSPALARPFHGGLRPLPALVAGCSTGS